MVKLSFAADAGDEAAGGGDLEVLSWLIAPV